jgi:hypothetical protein
VRRFGQAPQIERLRRALAAGERLPEIDVDKEAIAA